MGASQPIGATRIGAEVFRLDKFRAKIERSANPSGPDREGFFIFGDQAVVAIDSAGAPGPKSRRAGRSDIRFRVFQGDVVQREDRCFASSQCQFDSDRLHQFAVIAQR